MPSVIWYYGRNRSTNAVAFEADGVTYWFSYRTLVAFQVGNGRLVVRKNDWGQTTGRHLNAIDGGESKTPEGRATQRERVDLATFQSLYTQLVTNRDGGRS